MGKMVSPNEFFAAAKDVMLDGREPKSDEDRDLVMNFIARNADLEMVEPTCRFMNLIFDLKIPAEHVANIAKFQTERRLAGQI